MSQADFGQRIRIARGERGLTVEALAARAGLSPTAVTNLEMGRVARPRIQTILTLARVLHLDPTELLDTLEEAKEASA